MLTFIPFIVIVLVADPDKKVKEGVSYMAYMFAVFAAIIARYGVYESDVIRKGVAGARKFAVTCFPASAFFLLFGVMCQLCVQLRDYSESASSLVLWVSTAVVLVCLMYVWAVSIKSGGKAFLMGIAFGLMPAYLIVTMILVTVRR